MLLLSTFMDLNRPLWLYTWSYALHRVATMTQSTNAAFTKVFPSFTLNFRLLTLILLGFNCCVWVLFDCAQRKILDVDPDPSSTFRVNFSLFQSLLGKELRLVRVLSTNGFFQVGFSI